MASSLSRTRDSSAAFRLAEACTAWLALSTRSCCVRSRRCICMSSAVTRSPISCWPRTVESNRVTVLLIEFSSVCAAPIDDVSLVTFARLVSIQPRLRLLAMSQSLRISESQNAIRSLVSASDSESVSSVIRSRSSRAWMRVVAWSRIRWLPSSRSCCVRMNQAAATRPMISTARTAFTRTGAPPPRERPRDRRGARLASSGSAAIVPVGVSCATSFPGSVRGC